MHGWLGVYIYVCVGGVFVFACVRVCARAYVCVCLLRVCVRATPLRSIEEDDSTIMRYIGCSNHLEYGELRGVMSCIAHKKEIGRCLLFKTWTKTHPWHLALASAPPPV